MITEKIKKRQDLITKLIHANCIYVTMYGMHKSKDRIIEIKNTEIYKFVFNWGDEGPAFIYLWGWPGPDGNVYRIDDYGETWAFSKEELKVTNSENEQ